MGGRIWEKEETLMVASAAPPKGAPLWTQSTWIIELREARNINTRIKVVKWLIRENRT